MRIAVPLFLSVTVACMASEPSVPAQDDTPETMTLRTECTERRCDRVFRACMDNNAVYSRGGCVSTCTRSQEPDCMFCGPPGCGWALCRPGETRPRYDACLSSAQYFQRPRRDEAVAAACLRMMGHYRACGRKVDRDLCETFARVERIEVGPVYDCLAALPCGASEAQAEACQAQLPPTDLPARLCDRSLEGCTDCGSTQSVCSQEVRAYLDEGARWLRPDVLAAGESCLQRAAPGDYLRCFTMWMNAISLPGNNRPASNIFS